MRKFTQEEFDAIPRDECWIKRCPTGDYSAINEFPSWCSFGAECRFGRFGAECMICLGCWRMKNDTIRDIDPRR